MGPVALCAGDCEVSRRENRRGDAVRGSAAMTSFQPPAFLRGIEKSMIRKISDRAKPGSINLGLGEPDLPTPDVICRAAVRVILEEQNGYTLQAGLQALRELIATDYAHMNLSPDQV